MRSKRYFDGPSAVRTETADGTPAEAILDETPTTSVSSKRDSRSLPPLDDLFPHVAAAAAKRKTEELDDTDAIIDPAIVKRYQWGPGLNVRKVKTKFAQKVFAKREGRYEQVARQTARSEILLPEDQGFIEPDEACGEQTYDLTQKEIVKLVDIASAAKHFDLHLAKFAPYRVNYSRNGRQLLIGGRRGHVAAFDWQTKHLNCEINVMESVRDVQWLHIDTLFAVAQKRWVFIYDNKGTEIHCLKMINDPERLEFLPYHFLLVAATGTSFLHWVDVSIGKLVQSFPTRDGRLSVIGQNPANAIILTGSSKGTVGMWSPNVKEPLVKLLCHPAPVRGLSVDTTGNYMATTGLDQRLRLWDIRMFKSIYSSYRMPVGLGHVTFSQKRMIGCAVGTCVQIFKDCCTQQLSTPYLIHETRQTLSDLQFCPYEDVLGVGHQGGFSSLLVPGSGEPNFDALEANVFQTKKQRREFEVKALLDKIQPEMITLDTSEIAQVDTQGLEEKINQRMKILYLKPQKIDFVPRHKSKKITTAQQKNAVKGQRIMQHRKQQAALRRELDAAALGENSEEIERGGGVGAAQSGAAPLDKNPQTTKKAALDRFRKV